MSDETHNEDCSHGPIDNNESHTEEFNGIVDSKYTEMSDSITSESVCDDRAVSRWTWLCFATIAAIAYVFVVAVVVIFTTYSQQPDSIDKDISESPLEREAPTPSNEDVPTTPLKQSELVHSGDDIPSSLREEMTDREFHSNATSHKKKPQHHQKRSGRVQSMTAVLTDILMFSPTAIWMFMDYMKTFSSMYGSLPLTIWERADADYEKWKMAIMPRERQQHIEGDRENIDWWLSQVSLEFVSVFKNLEEIVDGVRQSMLEQRGIFRQFSWAFLEQDCPSWSSASAREVAEKRARLSTTITSKVDDNGANQIDWIHNIPLPRVRFVNSAVDDQVELILDAQLKDSCVYVELVNMGNRILNDMELRAFNMELNDVRIRTSSLRAEPHDSTDYFTNIYGFIRIPMQLTSTHYSNLPLSSDNQNLRGQDQQMFGEDIDVVWSSFIAKLAPYTLYQARQGSLKTIVKSLEQVLTDSIESLNIWKNVGKATTVTFGDVFTDIQMPQIQLMKRANIRNPTDIRYMIRFRYFRLPSFLIRIDANSETASPDRRIVMEARAPVLHGDLLLSLYQDLRDVSHDLVQFQLENACAIVDFSICILDGNSPRVCNRVGAATPWEDDVVFTTSEPRESLWPIFIQNILQTALMKKMVYEIMRDSIYNLLSIKIVVSSGPLPIKIQVLNDRFWSDLQDIANKCQDRHNDYGPENASWVGDDEHDSRESMIDRRNLGRFLSQSLTVDMLPIQPKNSDAFYLHVNFQPPEPITVHFDIFFFGIAIGFETKISKVEGPVLIKFVSDNVDPKAPKKFKFMGFLNQPVLEVEPGLKAMLLGPISRPLFMLAVFIIQQSPKFFLGDLLLVPRPDRIRFMDLRQHWAASAA